MDTTALRTVAETIAAAAKLARHAAAEGDLLTAGRAWDTEARLMERLSDHMGAAEAVLLVESVESVET